MKPLLAVTVALALSGIAACTPAPTSTPEPKSAPSAGTTPRPLPAAPAPPAVDGDNWMDLPQATGDWSIRFAPEGPSALFGETGSGARFSISCRRGARQIIIARAGANTPGATSMTIRTESVERLLAAQGQSSGVPEITAALPAGDSLFDAMAFSKGRFAVDSPGLSTLILPAWAEVSRVVEDCR